MTTVDAKPVMYPHGAVQRALNREPQIWFRSHLEAHWVNTFDTLAIKWDYEPHLFTLPNGQRYRPDFHLEELATWVEVKGPRVPRIEKTISLARLSDDSLVVAGFSPALIPGQGFKMRFRGVVNRCGFALCPDCRRYQWATETLECRACGTRIPEHNFYQHDAAPFHPAPWVGD